MINEETVLKPVTKEEIVNAVKSEQSAENELVIAKQLSGHPKQFNNIEKEILESLVRKNIAADFGNEGYARGYRWHELCGG